MIIEVEPKVALDVIEGAEYDDFRKNLTSNHSYTKYKTELGFIVEINKDVEPHQAEYLFFEESEEYDSNLTHLIEIRISHIKDEDEKEIETYRWGIESPEEVTEDGFGFYRVLLIDEKGKMNWLSDSSGVVRFDVLNDAKEAVKSLELDGAKALIL
jgi:hypothetical protein